MVHGHVPTFVRSRPALKMLPVLLQGKADFRRPRRLRGAQNFQPVSQASCLAVCKLVHNLPPLSCSFSLYRSPGGEKSHTRIRARHPLQERPEGKQRSRGWLCPSTSELSLQDPAQRPSPCKPLALILRKFKEVMSPWPRLPLAPQLTQGPKRSTSSETA